MLSHLIISIGTGTPGGKGKEGHEVRLSKETGIMHIKTTYTNLANVDSNLGVTKSH